MGSKRVRFDLGTGGGDGSPHRPPPPAPRARRTLLSMDVDADNDSPLVAGEAAACAAVRHDADAGPIRGVDPALAAATRAAARRGEASDLHTAEEPGPAPDVAAAASASGVPLVPFNMDDERSIGFFDACAWVGGYFGWACRPGQHLDTRLPRRPSLTPPPLSQPARSSSTLRAANGMPGWNPCRAARRATAARLRRRTMSRRTMAMAAPRTRRRSCRAR